MTGKRVPTLTGGLTIAVFLAAALFLAPGLGNAGKKAAQGKPTCSEADAGDNRHPSGKDRSCEAGRSSPQGRSARDPDGSSNGGADKPGGSGGVDLADQDGNNGCGNDDDFEDDNNGNCRGKAAAPSATATSTAAATQSATSGATTVVLGEKLAQQQAPTVVLGERFARTGAGILPALAAGFAAGGLGLIMRRAARSGR